MWQVISNIASICSIIALPIAIWQIFALKSKVESTEKGIRRVLEIKEHEKIEQIFKVIGTQYQEISAMISQVNKKGNSNPSITKRCQAINKELNKCVVEISPQYNDILESIKSAVKHIELFIESEMQSNSELKEARYYLNNELQKIKQEDMRFEDKTVSVISHSE